ncbi:hypothetical protein HDV00_005232 [Rhizophlyctis rosea]|nr:hypothetical protein HDV00_005232 [Rhizophlyctis rosea]
MEAATAEPISLPVKTEEEPTQAETIVVADSQPIPMDVDDLTIMPFDESPFPIDDVEPTQTLPGSRQSSVEATQQPLPRPSPQSSPQPYQTPPLPAFPTASPTACPLKSPAALTPVPPLASPKKSPPPETLNNKEDPFHPANLIPPPKYPFFRPKFRTQSATSPRSYLHCSSPVVRIGCSESDGYLAIEMAESIDILEVVEKTGGVWEWESVASIAKTNFTPSFGLLFDTEPGQCHLIVAGSCCSPIPKTTATIIKLQEAKDEPDGDSNMIQNHVELPSAVEASKYENSMSMLVRGWDLMVGTKSRGVVVLKYSMFWGRQKRTTHLTVPSQSPIISLASVRWMSNLIVGTTPEGVYVWDTSPSSTGINDSTPPIIALTLPSTFPTNPLMWTCLSALTIPSYAKRKRGKDAARDPVIIATFWRRRSDVAAGGDDVGARMEGGEEKGSDAETWEPENATDLAPLYIA